jgi:hypothetical protein
MASRLSVLGLCVTLLALAGLHPAVQQALTLPGLGALALLPRMALALMVVLAAENLYRNAPEAACQPALAGSGSSAAGALIAIRSTAPGGLSV